jgi:cyclase
MATRDLFSKALPSDHSSGSNRTAMAHHGILAFSSLNRLHLLGQVLRYCCECAVLVFALSLFSQAQCPDFEIVPLAKDVYAVVAKPGILGEWGTSNGVFIVNENDVVVVDTQMRPSWAAEVIAEIRKKTDKPVRYVINTHWHRDHTQGNQVYLDAFGQGVTIIQHIFTREDQIKNQPGELNERAPAEVARLEKLIATDKDEKGNDLDGANRARLAHLLAAQKSYLSEVPNIRVTPATQTFTDKIVLREGSREIDIKYFGYAHTRGDIVVYLPVEKIVVTGDLIQPGIPDTRSSYPVKWLSALQSLQALDWNISVPGHGAVQTDRTALSRSIAYFNDVISGVKAAVAKNMTAEQAVEAIDLKKYIVSSDHTFASSPAWAQNERNAAAVRRVYDEIAGKVDE